MKIETDELIVTFDDTADIERQVFKKVIEFYKQHECFSGESLLQSDDPIIEAPHLLADIADNIIKFEYSWKEE